MPIEILMPALSPTMEEGKLAKWLKKEGDSVASGDVIAEIETDKATMEVEAVDEGTIGKILVPEGTEGVRVNKPIAILLQEGEDASAAQAPGAAGQKPAPASQPAQASQNPQASPQASPAALSVAAAQPAAHGTASNWAANKDGQIPWPWGASSPLARRLAKSAGLDLTLIKGSGPRGRIVKADVERALREGVPTGAATAQAGGAGTALAQASASTPATQTAFPQGMTDKQILALYEEGSYEITPIDGMRKIIAQRLTESKVTIPHFYLSIECRLDELLSARARVNARSPKDGPQAYKLSVNDFIIKALALGLRDVPDANATWTTQGILKHKRCDVGVAVAVDGGLFTPVIRHADLKTLKEISNEMKDLAGRAKKRRLAPHEYQGGTTSISNLGMFGIKRFDAVINPPHATILAVGAGEERAIVVGGQITVATMMSCTLSCDHRVVDGALGAELLAAFKGYIEDPVRMLV